MPIKGFRLLYAISWLLLFWERFLNSFWPVLSFIALFLAASFLGLPLAGGPVWHFLFMTASALLLTAGILHSKNDFIPPDEEAVWHRIETDNQLKHRPLGALRDKPAGIQDIISLRLWQMHIKAALEKLKGRRLSPVRLFSKLAERDPYALRFASALLLLISFVMAGDRGGQRLAQTFSPPAFAKGDPGLSLDAWITPPAYTNHAPILLAGKEDILEIPAGSVLSLRLNGITSEPRVKIDANILSLKNIAPSSWSLDEKIQDGKEITLRSRFFWPLGSWKIKIIPDTPPMIGFAKEPEQDKKSALKLSYAASDDYGVTRLRTQIRRIALAGENSAPNEILELPVAPSKPIEETSISTVTHDLTSHPWSGLPVKIKMTATDAAGQTAETQEKDFVLPEREFIHPVARRIIADRRELIRMPSSNTRQAIAASALSLTEQPEHYNGDIVTFMALNSAGQRLLLDKTGASVPSVIDLLWKTAIRIEDGNLSVARDDLKKILDELVEKLGDKTVSEEDLRELMKKLETAMTEYANALNNEMRKAFAGQAPPTLPPELMNQLARRIDMDKVMDHLKNMAASDKRAAMQKFLQQMSKMVENLDPKAMKEYSDRQEKQMQELQKLSDVIKDQQKLLDQTNRHNDDNSPPALADTQHAIRKDLGGVMGEIGDQGYPIPDAFGRADQAMKEAAGDLDSDHAQQSIPHQQQALKELQGEMNQRLDQMAKAMEEMMMSMGFMPFGPGGQGGYDPLGRPGMTGNPDTSDVKIPDAQEIRKVQKIIEELRRRSGDPSRPHLEKNYIDRLLRQF